MSRLFDDGSSEYLRRTSSPVSSEPFTLACWFYTDTLAVDQALISVGDEGGTRYFAVFADSSDVIIATAFDGDSDVAAISTANYTTNTWHHACGVFEGSGDARVYLDGGNKGTDASLHDAITTDAFSIGATADSTPFGYASGRIAEAAAWDISLTDAEVAILAKGYSPLFIKPENLVAYLPLIRDEDQDRVGGYDLTPVNTPAIADHPPSIYPAPQSIIMAIVAAGANVPQKEQYYRRRR